MSMDELSASLKQDLAQLKAYAAKEERLQLRHLVAQQSQILQTLGANQDRLLERISQLEQQLVQQIQQALEHQQTQQSSLLTRIEQLEADKQELQNLNRKALLKIRQLKAQQ